jgi:hypothetical protein
MGDRANVYIREAENLGVYLYTHWGGTELPEVVRVALARKERWDDAPYLARIVFCEMVKGSESDPTGYGISASLCDNSYPIIVLDTATQQVRFVKEPTASVSIDASPVIKDWGFKQYAEQKAAAWPDGDD